MSQKPRCGLCGNNSLPLTKTECCKNWICDDENLGATDFDSCMKNHRYTLCSSHFAEGHMKEEPDWRKCSACKEMFDAEDYVQFITSEYNFNEPSIKYLFSTCIDCKREIDLSLEPHLSVGDNHFCLNCMLKPDKASKPAKKTQSKSPKRLPLSPGRKSPAQKTQPKSPKRLPLSPRRQLPAPRSKSTGTNQKKTQGKTKITSETIDKALEDEVKLKFGKKDKLVVEHQKRKPRQKTAHKKSNSTSRSKTKSKSKPKKVKPKKGWMLPRSTSAPKSKSKSKPKMGWMLPTFGGRSLSTLKTQSKSKSKSKSRSKSAQKKPRRIWVYVGKPNTKTKKNGSKSRDSSSKKTYGKRKASPSPLPSYQGKKVKKNSQMNQNEKAGTRISFDLGSNKSSRGRSGTAKREASHERSSSSSDWKAGKRKVKWIKRTY